MNANLKRWLIATTVLALAAMLAGCNTVKGMGTDIHDSTQHVQDWMEGSSK